MAFFADGYTMEQIAEEPGINRVYADAATKALEQTKNVPVVVGDVRTNGANPEARKRQCAAVLTVGTNARPITYTAQYTAEGSVYIEARGM